MLRRTLKRINAEEKARVRQLQDQLKDARADAEMERQAKRAACLLAWEKSADVIRPHGRNRELQRRLAEARQKAQVPA